MDAYIQIIDRDTPTPFNAWNKIRRVETIYNDNAKIRRAGKTLNLQQFMNENNKDCTIYDVMATYQGNKKLTAERMNTLVRTVSEDLANIKDLPSAFAMMKQAEISWRSLPLEVRKEFGNSVQEFQKNGLKWANDKIAEYDRIKKEQEKTFETTTKQEVKQNG